MAYLPLLLHSQAFSADPSEPRQGDLIEVLAPAGSVKAKMGSKTVPLYAQNGSSEMLGLMPVPVLAKPGPRTIEWLDQQGAVTHAQPIVVRDAHFQTQNVVLTPRLNNLHSTPAEREDVGEFLRDRAPERYWSKPFQPPLPGCITSPFGVRRLHNGKPTGEYHAGLDQRGAAGSPIVAMTAGNIKLAREFTLRGGTVAIDHGQGFESIYLHMSKIAAKEGQHVAAGDVIGYVGSTGRSTAPHLHWTVYANGDPVNPLQWMKLVPCTGPSRKIPRPPQRVDK